MAVRDLCCQKNLQEHTTKAVALLMHTMDSMQLNLLVSMPSLAVTLSEDLLSLTYKEEMIHYFRLLSQYLYCAQCEASRLDGDEAQQTLGDRVPINLLQKYLYLKERMFLAEDKMALTLLERAWDPQQEQDLWTSLTSKAQLSMQEWLELESRVKPAQDIMCGRQAYIFFWLTKHCPQSKHEVATQLLAGTLQYSAEDEDHSKFIQDLLSTIPLIVQHLGESSWLLSAWEELSRSYRHQDIFRVASNLPSWLLLSNSRILSGSSSSVESLSQFITTHLKDGLTEQGFLPRSVVWYVITAVSTLHPTNSSDVLSQLVDLCPALHASLLAHAQYLQTILSTTVASSGSSSVSRLQELTRVMLSPINENTPGHYWDNLEELVARCESWEVGLVLRNTHSSKMEVLEEYLPNIIPNWILFFKLMSFGNLFIEGKVKAEFLGKDLIVTNHKMVPKEYCFSYVLEEFYAKCKVLEILNSLFKSESYLPFCALSDYSVAATAIGVTVLLASVPSERLRTLDTYLVSQTLELCRKVWMNAISSTKLWYKLNAVYSADSDGQELYLLNSNFMKSIFECVQSLDDDDMSWE